jgi:hypothetical protein
VNNSGAGVLDQLPAIRKFFTFVREKVTHVHRCLVEKRAPRDPASIDRPLSYVNGDWTMMCAETQVVAILQEHRRIIGLTELARTGDDRFENRLDVSR